MLSAILMILFILLVPQMEWRLASRRPNWPPFSSPDLGGDQFNPKTQLAQDTADAGYFAVTTDGEGSDPLT